jgi:hypothetical protein
MKKYLLQKRNDSEILGTFDSKQVAANEMEEIIEKNNAGLDEDDDSFLTPFDFLLKKIEVKEEINEIVDSFESACKYLGVRHAFENSYRALDSLFKLIVIAEAWNKEDEFVPDFSNCSQYKYFNWFVYDDNTAGFVCVGTGKATDSASASSNIGSRLCFKTSERACQFGEQFIDLWNDFLLSR